jgi:hypothetical protein
MILSKIVNLRMRLPGKHIVIKLFALFFVLLSGTTTNKAFAQYGANDTIVHSAIVYNGDTIEAKTLQTVYAYGHLTAGQMSEKAKWTRLRNAVYVTYPYARRAGAIINDINAKLANVTSIATRREYIKTREKELRKEFTEPLTNLSVYQGRVLMKLINRETGNNCYEIIKEYKSGLTARFYQTVAFFFSTSLKQPYDAKGDDQQIEQFVLEVCRMYGYAVKG